MAKIDWTVRCRLARSRSAQRSITPPFGLGLLLLVATVTGEALAQGKPGGPSLALPDATVYFIDLKDGQKVPPTFTVRFGLKGMGVVPAGIDRDHAGHHHLLVDVEPPPFDGPIPNDPNHLHFGAGQTETEVTLPPGEHTLQLVLGDKNHVPHTPPVISDRIRVTVVDPSQTATSEATPRVRRASPKDAKVYFVVPRNGSTVLQNVVIRFGLINMGVAPAGVEKPNTGHHHLLIDTALPPLDDPIPNDPNHLHFGAGQTEARVRLPLGSHTLQLVLADEHHVPHDPPVVSEVIKLNVVSKLPRRTSSRRR